MPLFLAFLVGLALGLVIGYLPRWRDLAAARRGCETIDMDEAEIERLLLQHKPAPQKVPLRRAK